MPTTSSVRRLAVPTGAPASHRTQQQQLSNRSHASSHRSAVATRSGGGKARGGGSSSTAKAKASALSRGAASTCLPTSASWSAAVNSQHPLRSAIESGADEPQDREAIMEAMGEIEAMQHDAMLKREALHHAALQRDMARRAALEAAWASGTLERPEWVLAQSTVDLYRPAIGMPLRTSRIASSSITSSTALSSSARASARGMARAGWHGGGLASPSSSRACSASLPRVTSQPPRHRRSPTGRCSANDLLQPLVDAPFNRLYRATEPLKLRAVRALSLCYCGGSCACHLSSHSVSHSAKSRRSLSVCGSTCLLTRTPSCACHVHVCSVRSLCPLSLSTQGCELDTPPASTPLLPAGSRVRIIERLTLPGGAVRASVARAGVYEGVVGWVTVAREPEHGGGEHGGGGDHGGSGDHGGDSGGGGDSDSGGEGSAGGSPKTRRARLTRRKSIDLGSADGLPADGEGGADDGADDDGGAKPPVLLGTSPAVDAAAGTAGGATAASEAADSKSFGAEVPPAPPPHNRSPKSPPSTGGAGSTKGGAAAAGGGAGIMGGERSRRKDADVSIIPSTELEALVSEYSSKAEAEDTKLDEARKPLPVRLHTANACAAVPSHASA